MARRPLPLANIITLGVQDFDAQRDFYRRLGWPQALDSDDFAVFELRGILLALFPVDKLAADSHAQPEPGRGGIRFSIIINVEKPEDVDELAARVHQAGGKLTKDPVDAEFFVGRDAYFADPEGNFWEIACAPPGNPVVTASRRAAGLARRPTRLKPSRKGWTEREEEGEGEVSASRPCDLRRKVTGHRTRSTFDRYNIVNEEDAREVIRRLEAGRPGTRQDDPEVTARLRLMTRRAKKEAPRLSYREASAFWRALEDLNLWPSDS